MPPVHEIWFLIFSTSLSVALFSQNAKCMRRVCLFFFGGGGAVSCLLTAEFFPHYLINGTIFGEKVTGHEMCVLVFSTSLNHFSF
jgi:hypothetical protein